MITVEQLQKFSPKGKPDWLRAMAEAAAILGPHYRFTARDWRHFCAQWGAETDGMSLRSMRENMNFTSAASIIKNYSYRLGVALQKDAGLRSTYGSREALAAALVGNPKMLADVVYGGREGTPWMQGHLYIGRGPTQITHKDNYRAIAAEIRKQPGGDACPDLVEHPETLESPEWGVRAAFADWKIKNLSRWAADDNLEAVSSMLNTGSPNKVSITNGLPARRRWFARAGAVWPGERISFGQALALAERTGHEIPDEPVGSDYEQDQLDDAILIRPGDSSEKVTELQTLLHAKGYPCGAIDGSYGTLTQRAVLAIQHEHAITPDANVTQQVFDVLTQTAPADLGERSTLTADELEKRGSTTVPAAKNVTVIGKAMKWLGLGGGGTEVLFPGSIEKGAGLLAKIAEPISKVSDSLSGIITARTMTVIAACGVAALGWKLSKIGLAILEARLAAARSGANMER